jgi:signal transduction histidine kinase
MIKKAQMIEYIESIAPLLPVPLYWGDKNSIVLGVNKEVLKAAGARNYKDMVGKTPYDFYPEDMARNIILHNEKVMNTGETLSQEEAIRDISTGKTRYYNAVKAPLYNDNNKVIGFVGASIEITAEKEKLIAQKEAEQLKIANIKLEAENKLNQVILEKTALEANSERLRLENRIHKLEKEKHQLESAQQAQFRKIAAQVAHDIASPIFALQMILPRCDVLPENTRSALSKFSTRIIDITQNFLSQFKQKPEDSITINGITKTQASVYTELTEIITEKKYEYSNQPIKFVTEINSNSYFTFINADIDAFKRMMSNLINNSVDALEDSVGIITTHLHTIDDRVQIIIEDNGKGISQEVRDKILNNITITSGKIDGYGIGFSQIRDTLANNEGSFSIDSQLGSGTKITLTFPKIETPNWITSKIELKLDDLVVIVDDEPYVHEAWECQFKTFSSNIIRRHFEHGKEAIQFLNDLTDEEKKKVFLLTDYELLKQQLNGIDIINETKIERSILVTSHHNDMEIRKQAISPEVKILPKELAFAVIIKISP